MPTSVSGGAQDDTTCPWSTSAGWLPWQLDGRLMGQVVASADQGHRRGVQGLCRAGAGQSWRGPRPGSARGSNCSSSTKHVRPGARPLPARSGPPFPVTASRPRPGNPRTTGLHRARRANLPQVQDDGRPSPRTAPTLGRSTTTAAADTGPFEQIAVCRLVANGRMPARDNVGASAGVLGYERVLCCGGAGRADSWPHSQRRSWPPR